MSEGPTSWRIIEGDCRDVLAALPERSVHTCVTSPPYFGLRDYGHDRQIGLEPTPDEFVAALVDVFRGVRRVLRADGTVWLNLGDSYAANISGGLNGSTLTKGGQQTPHNRTRSSTAYRGEAKHKDLLGIPWMVAFALRADGWYLRSDIIWSKPNPMPESVTDRPTKAHEYVFLLSKRATYFYDADAIREPHAQVSIDRVPRGRNAGHKWQDGGPGRHTLANDMSQALHPNGRNRRSVWDVATTPFSGAHFATFPPKLIEPCILAGCPEGGTVLDPFAGSGTTGMVALRHGRSFVGVELSHAYAAMARERITADAPLLNLASEVAA